MTNDIINPGPPPLSRQAAERSIDLIDFMAAVVRGVDSIDVTPDVRERWVAHLANYFGMLAPMDRYWFATADATYANVQANWPLLPPQQQEMYKQAWTPSLGMVLQFADPVLQGQNLYTATAPSPDGAGSANAFGSGATMSDLMAQIHGQQQAAETSALKEGGQALQQQVQLQNDAVNMQMLSNISQMQYQSMMAVAKNMKY
jgi:hypothetical protein